MKRIHIILIIVCIILLLFVMYMIRRNLVYNKRKKKIKQQLKTCTNELNKLGKNKLKVNALVKNLHHLNKKDEERRIYKIKKLLTKKKYLEYILHKNYDEDLIDINIDNESNICIIMTGNEIIYPFYNKTIDINYLYAQNMGYDFKCIIGRVLDKNKYKQCFDRYKLLLNVMNNKKYKYIF